MSSLGGGGISAPGAPQNGATGAVGAACNPVGNGAMRIAGHYGEYQGTGRSGGPLAMFSRPPAQATWQILGITRDASGNALAGCNVDLFLHGTNAYVASTTSDGGGNYLFVVPSNGPYYVRVTDSQGSPTVAGASLPLSPQ